MIIGSHRTSANRDRDRTVLLVSRAFFERISSFWELHFIVVLRHVWDAGKLRPTELVQHFEYGFSFFEYCIVGCAWREQRVNEAEPETKSGPIMSSIARHPVQQKSHNRESFWLSAILGKTENHLRDSLYPSVCLHTYIQQGLSSRSAARATIAASGSLFGGQPT